ncbi:MAG: hypothetical protein GY870_18590 [archaeon]|nr:hypothetical protein [archaeon]
MNKNSKLLILPVTYFILSAILTSMTSFEDFEPFNMTLTHNFSIDTIILLFGLMISPILSIYVGVYFLIPLICSAHIKMKKKKGQYFKNVELQKKNFTDYFNKIRYPILLTINFGLIFSAIPFVHDVILTPEMVSGSEFVFNQIQVITFLFPLLSFLGVLFFIPHYILKDTGIYYSKTIQKDNITIISNTAPMTDGYSKIIKGYTGISVLINFVSLIISIALVRSEGSNLGLLLSGWLTMPISIGILLIPSMVFLNTQYPKFTDNTIKYLGKKIDVPVAKLEITES